MIVGARSGIGDGAHGLLALQGFEDDAFVEIGHRKINRLARRLAELAQGGTADLQDWQLLRDLPAELEAAQA